MSPVGTLYLVLSCVVIVAIGYKALSSPPISIAFLLASLPILNLARKGFPEEQPLFPSLETIAVIVLCLGSMIGLQKLSLGGLPRMTRQIFILFLIFLYTALLSTINSEDWNLSARIVIAGIIAPVICYYITSRSVTTFDDVQKIVLGIIAMGIIAGAYSVINLQNLIGYAGGMMRSEMYKWFYNEAPVVNFFSVPSAAVAAVIPGVPLGLWYLKHGTRFRVLVAGASLLGIIFVGIFSLSRGSWLAMILAFISSSWMLYRKRSFYLIAAILIGITLTVTSDLYQHIVPILDARMSGGISASDHNFTSRASNYFLALKSGIVHPLYGVGLGSYPVIYSELGEYSVEILSFAHNLFLTLIPETGAVGAAIFTLIFMIQIIASFSWTQQSSAESDLGSSVGIGLLSLTLIASTSGCHLVSYLITPTEAVYFTAPVMIVAFTLMGVVSSKFHYRAKAGFTN